MKTVASGVLALLVVVMAFVNSAQAAVSNPNPLNGTWSGQWHQSPNNGPITLNIGPGGVVNGTVIGTEGDTITLHGRVDRQGHFTATLGQDDTGTCNGNIHKVTGHPNRIAGTIHVHSNSDGDFDVTVTAHKLATP